MPGGAAVMHAAAMPSRADDPAADHGARLAPLLRLGLALAIALIAFAAGLRWIAAANTDLPPRLWEIVPDFAPEFFGIHGPAVAADLNASPWLRESAPLTREAKLASYRLAGQWDARFVMLATAALQALAAGGLCFVLAGRLRTGAFVSTLAAGSILIAFGAHSPRPSMDGIWVSAVLVLSLLHLCLMHESTPRQVRWWAGLLCGLASLMVSIAGIASALAMLVLSGAALLREKASAERRAIFGANAALVALGCLLFGHRNTFGAALADSFAELASFPLTHPAWAVIVWAPVLLALFRPIDERLRLLALWSVLQLLALVCLRCLPADDVPDLLLAGLIINAAVLATLVDLRDVWQVTAAGIWVIVIGVAVASPPNSFFAKIPNRAGPALESPTTLALSRFVATGDSEPLRATGAMAEADITWLRAVLEDPKARAALPASIRPPEKLESDGSTSGFRADGAPEIPGRDNLPAIGSWTERGGEATGTWTSQPLIAHGGLVQLRVAGEMRSPETAVVLRLADGREITPASDPFSATTRWKRVNFSVPAGAYRIVVRDNSPTKWIAVTSPVEISSWSWFAGKLVRSWVWWLLAGVAVAAGTLWQSRSTWRGSTTSTPSINFPWRVLPWLGLAAYALFFAQHLDPTAGPNDAGGYLNSAKLMASGHVTAAPREILGEHDVKLYLPSTFSVTSEGRMAPEYPMGFPLEVAAVASVLPIEWAVRAVILGQLLLGVWFTFRLARAMGLVGGWAWWAATLIGLCPVYLFQGLQSQSDGPALVWATAAIYWAWTSREKPWHAVLAGFATALAVLIRPSNVLIVFPVLVCFVFAWRRIFLWALAGLPAAAWQLWYNHALYGGALRTGYGDVGGGFALHFLWPTVQSYALWLPALLTPLVLLAFFGPFVKNVPRHTRVMLACWVSIFVVFYAFYWCTYDNWYNMRFVLPAMPAMVVLALFVVRALAQRAGWELFSGAMGGRARAVSIALVIAAAAWQITDANERRVLYWMDANNEHAYAAKWARNNLPEDAIVFARHASGSLYFYTDLQILRSDHALAKSPEFLARLAATGRPIYAFNYHWERHGYQWGNGKGDGYPDLPGDWDRVISLWEGEVVVYKWRAPAAAASMIERH